VRHRKFLGALVIAALCSPAHGQTSGKVYRVGVLAQIQGHNRTIREVLIPELARLGFVEGANLAFDYRAGVDELPRVARDLAGGSPDAILAIASLATRAAQQASSKIPIVFFGGQDAIQEGFAESLSRPGGNITGVVILGASLEAKRLQLLHDALPTAKRIAVLLYSKSPTRAEAEREVRFAAQNMGVDLLVLDAVGPAEYGAAFEAMKRGGAEALLIGANASFFADQDLLIGFAQEARLPTVCEWAEMARQGCTIGYGPDRVKLYQIAAGKLAQVLRGDPPATIPIETPAVFEFAVNLRAARGLGIELPPSLVARADEVIE
jgi:putative ABC transport system substrate-binding protein